MIENPLTTRFFSSNRQKLLSQLPDDCLVLLSAAQNVISSADLFYPFKQNPNFFYFSGILEADCLLLLIPNTSKNQEAILFIPKPSVKKKQWDGAMLDKEQAKKISGITEVEYLENFIATFTSQQNWRHNLYIESNALARENYLTKFNHLVHRIKKQMPGLCIKKIDSQLAKLRSKKTSEEIKLIKKAIDITYQTFIKVYPKIKYLKKEYQVAAELEYQYKMQGSQGESFASIVASGSNATILHYSYKQSTLKKGDLLLLDTGASYCLYNSDISRTIPINGKFTNKQKKYYNLVLQMQTEIIEELKLPISWFELYQKASKIQGKILKKTKLIKNSNDHKELTVHRIGHSLGLDVHDPVNYQEQIQPGTILTIEPGLYLPKENIGIRIEDDILITQDGYQNLSVAIPKTTDEIEKLLA